MAELTSSRELLTLTPLAGLLVAFALSLGLTPLVRRLAQRLGAVDLRSDEKIHARDTPRLGGLAIAAGFYVPMLALASRFNLFEQALYASPRRMAALLGGGLAILALGVYDDLRGADAATKLAVQIPVAAAAWLAGVRIGGTAVPSGHFLAFAPALSLAVTIVWLVAVVNALNLIDGLDGLASGVALLALAATALTAWHRGEPALALIAVVLVGTVAGFLVHNFHPATIFMGDSGSMFLGYVLGVAAVWSSQKEATTIGTVLPALALGVPLLDTSLAVWRRLMSGRPVLHGDLHHLHHRLLAKGFSQRGSVLLLYGVASCFAAASVALGRLNDRRVAWAALALSVLAALAFSRWIGAKRQK